MPVNRIDSIVVLTICAEVDMRLLTEPNHEIERVRPTAKHSVADCGHVHDNIETWLTKVTSRQQKPNWQTICKSVACWK